MEKKDKIVLITGASKGIGFALAEKMIEKNYFVIGTSRNGKIDAFNQNNFLSLKLDLSENKSIQEAHKQILDQFNHIDILINNAGIGPDLGTLIPEGKTFNQTFDVNVSGTVFFTEPLIKIIKEGGMLLNISSKMGALNYCTSSDSVAYRMSKSALNMYTKILANRLNGKVNVASIHPGWVKTTIIESNLINARLTPKQSADKIYSFLSQDFESGTYWNCEDDTELLW